MIKDSLTLKPLFPVPKGLVNTSKRDILNVFKQFMWVDDHKIKLINDEGIEKVIDIYDNFRELGYNAIPMY